MPQVQPTAAALVPIFKPLGHQDQHQQPFAIQPFEQTTYAIAPPQPTQFSSVPKLATMTDSKGGLTIVEEITKIVYSNSNTSTLSNAPLPTSTSGGTTTTEEGGSPPPPSSSNYSTVTSTRYFTSYIPSASPLPSASTFTASQTSQSTLSSAPPQPTSTSPSSFFENQNNIHSGGLIHPNNDQLKTVWVAAIMLFALLIGWNMIILRDILYPWKMWGMYKLQRSRWQEQEENHSKEIQTWLSQNNETNSIHEAGHIVIGALTGARVYSVTIDPDKGPISGMTGGIPVLILTAGYLSSILIGSSLIMAAFDITASKIAALIVYPMLAVCFWFGRCWARIRILICIGLSIGFFFINHANALRFYVLFLGVLNAFYVLWDSMDDFIFRKQNESDVALFSRMSKATTSSWILLWLIITLIFVTLAILGGLHFFDKSMEAQQAAQEHFMPT